MQTPRVPPEPRSHPSRSTTADARRAPNQPVRTPARGCSCPPRVSYCTGSSRWVGLSAASLEPTAAARAVAPNRPDTLAHQRIHHAAPVDPPPRSHRISRPAARAQDDPPPPAGSFKISFDPTLQSTPYTGRVLHCPCQGRPRRATSANGDWFGGSQTLALDVQDLAPGGSVIVGAMPWPSPSLRRNLGRRVQRCRPSPAESSIPPTPQGRR
jgi:hypothetical protein